MPLLLNQDDLRPLLSGATFYPELFQLIRASLLRQDNQRPGVVSWLAFPTAQEAQKINLHLMSTPVEGTSIRLFPHRVGAQARDSMAALLFDENDGHILALIALDDLGPLRTSAPAAFAAQLLAPPQSTTLALIGSGLQARYHLQGLRHALPTLTHVRVYSPTPEHRQHFADEMSKETGLNVEAVETSRQAIQGADVIAVTAASFAPTFAAEDVQPGALVTNVAVRAVPPDLYNRARLVVPDLTGPDHHASGWDPFPFKLNGGRPASMIATTLVDILREVGSARQSAEDIVIYEQTGSFAWDGAILRWPYDWAVQHQIGTPFHLSSRA
jgi:alanine dehydrogenase